MSWVADADRSPAAWPRLRLSSQRATGGKVVRPPSVTARTEQSDLGLVREPLLGVGHTLWVHRVQVLGFDHRHPLLSPAHPDVLMGNVSRGRAF